MMKRVWLILADTLVILLLLLSFVLFYLYPPVYMPPKVVPKHPAATVVDAAEPNCTVSVLSDENVTLSMLSTLELPESNTSGAMSLEEILQLSQEVAMQEYLDKNTYIYTPLSKRLEAVGAKEGDPVYNSYL